MVCLSSFGVSVCLSVCLSVCHTSEPCKIGCTNWDAVWVEDLSGPKEACIRWGSRSPHGKGEFWGGKGRPIVKFRDTLRLSVQKRLNQSRWRLGCGLRLAQGIMNCMGSRSPMGRGSFGGKGRPFYSIGTFCRELCKSGWTDRFVVWVLVGPKKDMFSSICQVAPMCLTTLSCELWKNGWTLSICHLGCGLWWAERSTSSVVFTRWLAPPGEYNWTVCLWRRCGALCQITLTTCYYCIC